MKKVNIVVMILSMYSDSMIVAKYCPTAFVNTAVTIDTN